MVYQGEQIMSTISVIVPVYKVEQYLHRCLDSILNQTFTGFEIILVDDGSTDGSGEICDRYAAKYNNIKVIHKENGGLSSARNAGLEIAKGKYIMFVDSDDMIHSKTLEKQLSILHETDADAVICSFQRFFDEKEIDISSDKISSKITVFSGSDVEKQMFTNTDVSNYVSSCGKIFKRELFNDISFPVGRLFEDEFTTYKIYYKCKKIAVTDDIHYFYYINTNGITGTLNINKRFDEYDAQFERIQFFKENNCSELYHLSILKFLNTAQWDLIECQQKRQEFNAAKAVKFQNQYTSAMNRAKAEKIVSFSKNYDYYVLAYPKQKLLLRAVRLLLKTIRKMN